MEHGIYRHFRGGLYTVLFEAVESTNGPDEGKPKVIYVSHETGRISCRLTSEFTAVIQGIGPRFMRVA